MASKKKHAKDIIPRSPVVVRIIPCCVLRDKLVTVGPVSFIRATHILPGHSSDAGAGDE
jgi:hypothetical protein